MADKEQCPYCNKMYTYLNRHVCKNKPNEEVIKKLEEKGKQLEGKAKLITKGGKSDKKEVKGLSDGDTKALIDGLSAQNAIIIKLLEKQNELIGGFINGQTRKDSIFDKILNSLDKIQLLADVSKVPQGDKCRHGFFIDDGNCLECFPKEVYDEQAAADAALYEDLQEQIEPDKPAPKELKFTPKFKSKKAPKKKGFRMIPQKKAPKKEVGFTFPKSENFTTADKVIYNTKADNSNGNGNGDKKKRLFASIKGETEKALLLDFGENDKEAWIPKSVIQSKYENVEGKNQNFIVQSWIIKKNNLEEYAMEE